MMYQAVARGSVMSITVVSEYPGLVIATVPGAAGPFLSNVDEAPFEISVTGGYPPYSYHWSISEDQDPSNLFSVQSQGTGATANDVAYGDYIIETTFTQPAPPTPPNPPTSETGEDATFIVSCQITDNKGTQVTESFSLSVGAV